MDIDWTTSPSARRVLQHGADPRPAWLWSHDGERLLWQNQAAPLFLGKLKKHGLKLAAPAVPIKGQVARNIRLGSPGRTSLSRVQFLAGEKPASTTCATTPLPWQDGQMALLIVGVDAIPHELIAAAAAVIRPEPEASATDEAAWPEHEAVADEAPPEAASLEEAIAAEQQAYERELGNWRAASGEPGAVEAAGPASVPPEDHAATGAETAIAEAPVVEEPAAETVQADGFEPVHDGPAEHVGDEAIAEPEMTAEAASEAPPAAAESPEPPTPRRLAALIERLADHARLYTPLTEADDVVLSAPAPARLYTVTGRGFLADHAAPERGDADLDDPARLDEAAPADDDAAAQQMEAALAELAPREEPPDDAPPDAEAVERVSRYNFDELSRILNDRVGETAPQPQELAETTPARPGTGALINLGGETLVLNRLPLGILVFRDQQVLFANRAITEMVGYDSVESLREAGLAAVFPAVGPQGQAAGPVNHLVQRDGTLVPVTARLQSISWQGRPALMLSASATEVRTGHEAAVRAFAESLAGMRGDGFFESSRSGTISAVNGRAAELLGLGNTVLAGKQLASLVAPADGPGLRAFLERPARFAETTRPCITLRGVGGAADVMLFAQGQAGVLTGYFGFVHGREGVAPVQIAGPGDADPALLARISRGVRRPLNTIIGFSDLIRSGAFGAVGNERYESYAADITTAGHEIAALVDELDDYTRLRDGRYLPQRARIDLTGLLESCVVRIRHQAGRARVIVRNAISETLPKVTADRASLAQAVLNLLASAIDQTPSGGAVVISAQREDNGSITIHVRDSSTTPVDMAERFVVFRDGVGRDGQVLTPVRSSVGLALTRSLLAVNAFSLSVDPAGDQGMLFSLVIPADLVEQS